MAEIQFVDFPTYIDDKVIKYGYIPRVDGGADWYVVVRFGRRWVTEKIKTDSYASAKAKAEELAGGFKC